MFKIISVIKKNKFASVFWIIFYFVIFIILLQNSFSYLDPDLGWHLKAGEHISQTKEISRDNFYNYTFSGNWINHEWLTDTFIFQIYDNLGYLSLNVLFALLIVVVLILLNILAKKLAGSGASIFIAIFQLLGIFSSLPSLGVRMQEFGILFLLLELIILNNFLKTKKKRYLAFLIPLLYLWSNTHGSFLFGLALILFFVVIKIFERLISFSPRINKLFQLQILTKKEIIIILFFFLLALGATFLTPYKLELYSFLEGYKNTAYLHLIQEWKPFYFWPINYISLSYLALLGATWLLYFYEAYHNRAKLNFWELSLFLLLFILSLKSGRHFPLAFVATFPYLIKMLTTIISLRNIRFIANRPIKSLLIFCLILIGASFGARTIITHNPFTSFCNKYPCQAVNFLKESPEYFEYNIFNEYGWGGFLIWSYPEKKIFIDGRLPQAEFAGHTFIEEYVLFFSSETNLKEKLQEYDINLVLLKAKNEVKKINKFEKLFFHITNDKLTETNPLRDYLLDSNDWKIAYQDETALVFVKR